jgi:hypothetical protein
MLYVRVKNSPIIERKVDMVEGADRFGALNDLKVKSHVLSHYSSYLEDPNKSLLVNRMPNDPGCAVFAYDFPIVTLSEIKFEALKSLAKPMLKNRFDAPCTDLLRYIEAFDIKSMLDCPVSDITILKELKNIATYFKLVYADSSHFYCYKTPASEISLPVDKQKFDELINKIYEIIQAEINKASNDYPKFLNILFDINRGISSLQKHTCNLQIIANFVFINLYIAYAEHPVPVWKQVVLNLLIAMTGIGLIVLSAKAIHSKIQSGTAHLFFNQSSTQQDIKTLQNLIYTSLPPYPGPHFPPVLGQTDIPTEIPAADNDLTMYSRAR